MPRRLSRRAVVGSGVGVVAAGLGALGWGMLSGAVELPGPLQRRLADQGPDGVIPTVPAGRERVTTRHSEARGRDVTFYTAVPDGYGDGHGLPVCLVLHGASATADSYVGFGFGRFLTDAVRHGAPPFVLAGATGSRYGWERQGSDYPLGMVHDEIPQWCSALGFDTSRMVAWGWSLGGRGVLVLAEAYPRFVRAVAAFSPAIGAGDDAYTGVGELRGTAVGLWCGRSDGFYHAVRSFDAELPEPAKIAAFAQGAHTRGYWNRVTPAAFAFLAGELAEP